MLLDRREVKGKGFCFTNTSVGSYALKLHKALINTNLIKVVSFHLHSDVPSF